MLLARPFACAFALALAAGAAFTTGDASAQQIFKIVGPDGKVTFTDQKPLDPSTKATQAPVVPISKTSTNLEGLPFELRQAATRYPVTLYTSPGCSTCAQGRAMLVTRGVPFTEKLVATKDDGEALSRIAGSQTLPLLTIGGQQLKGYSDSEWQQFLDAAGYPKTSLLPPTYVPSPATPLVALDQRPANGTQASPGTAQDSRAVRAPSQPTQPPPENPAGIQF
jgi:glutaredoxin